MPTNLGALDLQRVPPIAIPQRFYSAVNAAVRINNGWAAGTPVPNGTGGNMAIFTTPLRRAWWIVEAQAMVSSPDLVWSMIHLGVRINPADRDGVVLGTLPTCAIHGSIGWRTVQAHYAFQLEANVAYSATLTVEASSNNNQDVHQNGYYTHLHGHLIEGSV